MPKLHGFNKKELLDVYRKMIIARRLDEKMMILIKQGKSFFHIACSGHEAAQLAAADAGKTTAEVDSTWLELDKDIFGGSKSFDLPELKYPFSN